MLRDASVRFLHFQALTDRSQSFHATRPQHRDSPSVLRSIDMSGLRFVIALAVLLAVFASIAWFVVKQFLEHPPGC